MQKQSFHQLCDISVETERTYCFTTICNKTCSLLEGFLEVVFKSLVLVLFGSQLHEFTWRITTIFINGLFQPAAVCNVHKQSKEAWIIWMMYRTSHQVLYHLGQHFYHSVVTNTSQGHGGGWEDEIPCQDSLKETAKRPWPLITNNSKDYHISGAFEFILLPLPFFHPTLHSWFSFPFVYQIRL